MQDQRTALANSERVWTLDELQLLNEVQKPIAAVVSTVCEDPHRSTLDSVTASLQTRSQLL